jgi:hypothetical protein
VANGEGVELCLQNSKESRDFSKGIEEHFCVLTGFLAVTVECGMETRDHRLQCIWNLMLLDTGLS